MTETRKLFASIHGGSDPGIPALHWSEDVETYDIYHAMRLVVDRILQQMNAVAAGLGNPLQLRLVDERTISPMLPESPDDWHHIDSQSPGDYLIKRGTEPVTMFYDPPTDSFYVYEPRLVEELGEFVEVAKPNIQDIADHSGLDEYMPNSDGPWSGVQVGGDFDGGRVSITG